MFVLKALVLSAVCACVYSQGYDRPNTTPVPILKQINKQNDDGSYSFGYEAADGSFKIETKYPNGDVAGKYGYVDADGKVREVSYGASSQRGFEPQGTGIMVPPPTLNDPKTNALTDGQEDDGQYREDPRIYEDSKYNGRTGARPSSSFNFKQPAARQQFQSSDFQTQDYQPQAPAYQPRPQYQQTYQPAPQKSLFTQSNLFDQAPQQFSQPQQPRFNQDFRPQSQIYHQQPQFSYQSYTPQQQYQNYQPQPQTYQNNLDFNPFAGHPAQNFDPSTGSYSINFTG
ncbi:mushroom body large-type Kenyon cell-specific protein 1-like [Aricia agestis]|uniref:mushroom body large-type Kenyon cell-specific protein 1-like n=1 Tax=Aricia agestis TaxID=91739 RepID=UPI001C203D50|nr:mushroom body large-type Kenyon cell-specific protein 1-like [Aricia agestis]